MFRIVAILAGLLAVSFNSSARADEGAREVLLASAMPMATTSETPPRPFSPMPARQFIWTGILFFEQGQPEPIARLVEWTPQLAQAGISAVTRQDVLFGHSIKGNCIDGVCTFVVPEGLNGLYRSFTTTNMRVVLHMNTGGLDCRVEIPAVRTIIQNDLGGHLYKPSMRDARSTGPDAVACDLHRAPSQR